jgi:hypothetical protein
VRAASSAFATIICRSRPKTTIEQPAVSAAFARTFRPGCSAAPLALRAAGYYLLGCLPEQHRDGPMRYVTKYVGL